MKKLFFLIFFSMTTSLLSAQTMGYYEAITFDSPHPTYISLNTADSIILKIDTSASENIWQIGKPHKTLFDSAYSRPNAIVTDTIHYYPPNNSSAFTIKIFDPAWTGYYIEDQDDISFKHKYDTDSLRDGGYVEISYDNGVSWTNIANDTIGYWDPHFYNPFFSLNPIIANGNAAFTGNSKGWRQSEIYGCNFYLLSNPYPVYLRFVFSSDSIQTNKEGWMIDNISICLGCGNCLGINEAENKELISIFPNPATDELTIETQLTSEIEISNLEGQVVKKFEVNDGKLSIDISDLNSGIYIIRVQTDKGITTKKFIKQ